MIGLGRIGKLILKKSTALSDLTWSRRRPRRRRFHPPKDINGRKYFSPYPTACDVCLIFPSHLTWSHRRRFNRPKDKNVFSGHSRIHHRRGGVDHKLQPFGQGKTYNYVVDSPDREADLHWLCSGFGDFSGSLLLYGNGKPVAGHPKHGLQVPPIPILENKSEPFHIVHRRSDDRRDNNGIGQRQYSGSLAPGGDANSDGFNGSHISLSSREEKL